MSIKNKFKKALIITGIAMSSIASVLPEPTEQINKDNKKDNKIENVNSFDFFKNYQLMFIRISGVFFGFLLGGIIGEKSVKLK